MGKRDTKPTPLALKECKNLIWPIIDKYLKSPHYPAPFQIPKKYSKEADFQWKIFRDYPERKGKYIRPTLVVLTTGAMTGSLVKAFNTAGAMQLSEDWMLGHDDFEDNSVKRRGLPALHRIYGPELAVNAGDMLHAIMWKMLADNSEILDSKKFTHILNEFYIMLSRTILGQGVEISWSKRKVNSFSNLDWYFIADGKTSYYTITHPIRLGAIIGNANKIQLEKINAFGKNLGRGFQLIDDILDVTSDFSGLKIQGNDIYEGKKTVLLGHLLRVSDKKNKKKILRILNKDINNKTPSEVKFIIEKMTEYGSIDYAKKLAEKYKQIALKIFDVELKFLKIEPYRSQLRGLINFIIEREY